MEIFFRDPNQPLLPRSQVRITDLRAEPRPDGKRVRVYLALTAFQERPSGEIRILNAFGDELASASFIETISPRMEFTLHLRGELSNPCQLKARVFYPLKENDSTALDEPKLEVVDQQQTDFQLPAV